MVGFSAWSEAADLLAGDYQRHTPWFVTLTAVFDGIEVQAVGRFAMQQTRVSAHAPDLAGVTIRVRDRMGMAPWDLARLTVEESRFAETLCAYADNEDIARVVLSPAQRRALAEADALGRYEIIIAGGEVLARRGGVMEEDAGLLVRMMRVVGSLAARPRQLAAQWGDLAQAVGGQRPEPAAWRLTASDPIMAMRSGVAVAMRAHVASPGEPLDARLYTEYACAPARASARFVLCARDWNGPLPGDIQDAEQPLGLGFLAPYFRLFQDDAGLDATRQRCRALHVLARSHARFVMVEPDRVSMWVPGLVSDFDTAEAALQSVATLAGGARTAPYR